MKMEQTECSETSVYKIQMPGNYPEENIQHTEHGESLKPRLYLLVIAAGGKCEVFRVKLQGCPSLFLGAFANLRKASIS